MELYLDDEPIAIAGAETLTLQQVVESLTDRLAADKRLVTAIRCDGRPVEPEELDAVLEGPAGRFGRVELQSSAPGPLAREVLSGAAEMIVGSEEARREAVDLLNEGRTGQAMELLGAFFRSWSQVYESAVKSSHLVGVNLAEMKVDGAEVCEWLDSFARKLRELKQSLEAGDLVSVADVLRYEFDAVASEFRALIDELLPHAEAASPPTEEFSLAPAFAPHS